MKRTKIIYWVVTAIFLAAMLMSAFSELFQKDAAHYLTDLGYSAYLNPFLGVAKLLGIIAILLPGFPRLKEWAYAGFTFDLLGASYSMAVKQPDVTKWLPFMLVFLVLLFASYILYHKKAAAQS
jgi:uncharacterized membrane protein